MTDSREITVILGPTASGKSALAMALAQQVNGEILSVDSMQVYRGMDIGTAKPTADQQRAVRHHLIDVADPTEEYTVARFVEAADAIIAQPGPPLIVTGGTPLFYKALFHGLFDGPGADESLRTKLRTETNDALHARLSQVDPPAAARIHANDTKRLIRALEVFELTGRPITSFQTEWVGEVSRHRARWFGLDWDKDELNRRINARVKTMIAAGWIDETRELLRKYGKLSKTAGEAAGYCELIEHLEARSTLDNAVEQIKIATRQLARRQMKWFRRFPNVRWLAGMQADQLLAQVRSGGE